VTVNNILHRGGHQEILLAQAQRLALWGVIRRVKYLADGLCHGRLLHSLNILALIKQTHIQCRLASRPQAQTSHTVAQTTYIHIIGHSDHGVAIPHSDGMVLTVPAFINPALKTDSLGALLTGHQPNLSAGQPKVRQLRLPAVYQLLLKNAGLIANGIAHGLIAVRGQTVQITGSQTTQAAVAQTGIRLLIVQLLQLYIKAGQCLFKSLSQTQVIQVVL